MKVFLAWNGAASHRIAKLLHGWLPDVIQSIEPFMSSEDIRTGTRWFNEIGTQLEQTNFGILCTTPANLDSTWMHFEAGAVSKNVPQARVCALLFELKPSDIALPLSQFQHVGTTQQELLKLMQDIDEASPDKKLGKERVERAVQTNWQRLSAGFEDARGVLAEELKGRDVPRRTSAEILTDVFDAQQGVLARLQRVEMQLSLVNMSISNPNNPWYMFPKSPPGGSGGLLGYLGGPNGAAAVLEGADVPQSLGQFMKKFTEPDKRSQPQSQATPTERPKEKK